MEQIKVCDGEEDCPKGEDEGMCATLARTMFVEEDEFGRPKDQSPNGYLLVRLAGSWYTYTYNMWETYHSHLICLQLGYFMARDTSPRNAVFNATVKGWLAEEKKRVVVKDLGRMQEVKVVWIDCMTERIPVRSLVKRSLASGVKGGDGLMEVVSDGGSVPVPGTQFNF